MARTIPCQKGCPPARTNIGTGVNTVRWKYVPANQGSIISVTELPNPPFSNGRQSGSDYIVDYAGAPQGEEWEYTLTSDPPCADKAEQAQLTSGP